MHFFFKVLLHKKSITTLIFHNAGKLAIFKAKVIGNPSPTVTWRRAKGEMNDPQKFQSKFDPTTNEYTLEVSTDF